MPGPFLLLRLVAVRMVRVVMSRVVMMIVVMAGKGGDAHQGNGEEKQQQLFHGRILAQLRDGATVSGREEPC